MLELLLLLLLLVLGLKAEVDELVLDSSGVLALLELLLLLLLLVLGAEVDELFALPRTWRTMASSNTNTKKVVRAMRAMG